MPNSKWFQVFKCENAFLCFPIILMFVFWTVDWTNKPFKDIVLGSGQMWWADFIIFIITYFNFLKWQENWSTTVSYSIWQTYVTFNILGSGQLVRENKQYEYINVGFGKLHVLLFSDILQRKWLIEKIINRIHTVKMLVAISVLLLLLFILSILQSYRLLNSASSVK